MKNKCLLNTIFYRRKWLICQKKLQYAVTELFWKGFCLIIPKKDKERLRNHCLIKCFSKDWTEVANVCISYSRTLFRSIKCICLLNYNDYATNWDIVLVATLIAYKISKSKPYKFYNMHSQFFRLLMRFVIHNIAITSMKQSNDQSCTHSCVHTSLFLTWSTANGQLSSWDRKLQPPCWCIPISIIPIPITLSLCSMFCIVWHYGLHWLIVQMPQYVFLIWQWRKTLVWHH